MSNFEYVDNIYRSRITILDILEKRGYNVSIYRKFSPAEISIATEFFPSLSFQVEKTADKTQKCIVKYAKLSRQKLETVFDDIAEDDVKNTEVIVMMAEPVADVHHVSAIKQFMTRKLRISFFCVQTIVNNPMKHVMVPLHEIVPKDEHKKLLESLFITIASKLPLIRFHADPIVRCLGAVPGDIVKITRPSPSAGEYIVHRFVSL